MNVIVFDLLWLLLAMFGVVAPDMKSSAAMFFSSPPILSDPILFHPIPLQSIPFDGKTS